MSMKMAPLEFAQLEISPLTPAETVDIQGTQYNVWQASNLAPGEGFQLELTNLPVPSLVARFRSSIGNTGFWVTGIPVLMGVVLACLMLFGSLTRPSRTAMPTLSGPVYSSAVQTGPETGLRVELVRELAILDQRYEAGEAPDEEYQAQRQRLKAEILGPPVDPGGES